MDDKFDALFLSLKMVFFNVYFQFFNILHITILEIFHDEELIRLQRNGKIKINSSFFLNK